MIKSASDNDCIALAAVEAFFNSTPNANLISMAISMASRLSSISGPGPPINGTSVGTSSGFRSVISQARDY